MGQNSFARWDCQTRPKKPQHQVLLLGWRKRPQVGFSIRTGCSANDESMFTVVVSGRTTSRWSCRGTLFPMQELYHAFWAKGRILSSFLMNTNRPECDQTLPYTVFNSQLKEYMIGLVLRARLGWRTSKIESSYRPPHQNVFKNTRFNH